jgi:flagellar biosynthesis/type III secretory pathway protein FliH
MTEERQKRAEELAGPHEPAILSATAKANEPGRRGYRSCDFWIDYDISRCNCPRRERVQAILAFGDAERAAGREEGEKSGFARGIDETWGYAEGYFAGKAEGREEAAAAVEQFEVPAARDIAALIRALPKASWE